MPPHRTPHAPADDLGPDERVGALAHDLRNSIALVLGRSQLLARRVRRGEGLERGAVLDGLAAIEDAAKTAVVRLERLERVIGTPTADAPSWRRESLDDPHANADG